MNFSCLLDLSGCLNDGLTSLIDWYPFGIEGIKATVWMAVGAILGKVGVSLVVGLALALKVSGKKEPEVVAPKPVIRKKTR